MAKNRVELQTILENILGSRNVYYQPPESMKIKYPCIVYRLNAFNDTHANDDLYVRKTVYDVILIDDDADSEFMDKLDALTYCKFSRMYSSDNMYHYVFTLNY